MFEVLQFDEKILGVKRRHWFYLYISLFGIGFIGLLALLAPLALTLFAFQLMRAYFSEVFFGVTLFLEIVWIVIFYTIADYYLDYWIITDRRIILIKENGIFNRVVQTVDFESIQDISTKIVGVFPTVLDFGDVIIQSAGTRGRFVFEKVPKPAVVRDQILKAREDRSSLSRGKDTFTS